MAPNQRKYFMSPSFGRSVAVFFLVLSALMFVFFLFQSILSSSLNLIVSKESLSYYIDGGMIYHCFKYRTHSYKNGCRRRPRDCFLKYFYSWGWLTFMSCRTICRWPYVTVGLKSAIWTPDVAVNLWTHRQGNENEKNLHWPVSLSLNVLPTK